MKIVFVLEKEKNEEKRNAEQRALAGYLLCNFIDSEEMFPKNFLVACLLFERGPSAGCLSMKIRNKLISPFY